MDKYLKLLIMQFKQATGTKNVDINSEQFIKEFSEWIKGRKLIGSDYASFIDYMQVFPTLGDSTVEIGKGKHDSIVLGSNIPIITPHSEGIIHDAGIITADFRVYDTAPFMIRHNKVDNQVEEINTEYIRRFMTQNPYAPSDIQNWDQLHNRGDNITVGIFGSIYDKDIDSKIRQIEMLRDKMSDGYKEDYATDNDSYYYAIASTRKVNVKVKTRLR